MKWSVYNQSLFRRGEIILGFDVINNWDTELNEMNKYKDGESFHYPNTFLLLLGYAKMYFHLPYRQTEGITQRHAHGKAPSIPDYTTINRLDIKIKDTDSKNKEFEDDYIVIAIDSTGIKATNRGQWMRRDKWKAINNNNKGYLKIRIAVNVKSKKIFSMKVTDEHVHDNKALPQLVEDIIKSDSMTSIGKVFADGAYDGNDIFRYLSDNGILPCIKVRKNAKVRLKTGHILRKSISFGTQDTILKDGKDSVSRMAKDGLQNHVFCIKSIMFDSEYVYSVRLEKYDT